MATRDSLSPTARPSRAPTDELGTPDEAQFGFLLAAVFAIGVAAFLAVLWLAFGPALAAVESSARWLRGHDDVVWRASLTVVLVAAVALGFIAAWARATSPNRPVRLAGGRGTMPVREVAEWLRDALEARSDVRQASVGVERHGAGVRVAARIAVTPDARIEETARGTRTIVEQVLASHVGVPLVGAPAIELRYEELRLRPRGPSEVRRTDE